MSENALDNIPERKSFWSPLISLEVTPPEWLIEGWLPCDCFGMMFGEASAGKSFIALDMSAIIASGRGHFHNHKTKGKPMPVFYLCGEGKNGLRGRLEAWLKRGKTNGLEPSYSNLENNLFISESSTDLSSCERVEELIEEMERVSHEPALLVVDTVSRNVGGANTNDATDMNRFVNNCQRIREHFKNMTVLVIHHSGHKNKERAKGDQGLVEGAPDFTIRVDKQADLTTMTSTKLKDGDPPKPLTLQFQRVLIDKDEGGLGIYSSHLTRADGVKPSLRGLGGIQKDVFDVLKKLEVQSREKGLDGAVTLEEFKHVWRQGEGRDTKNISRTLKALASNGNIWMKGEVIKLRQ